MTKDDRKSTLFFEGLAIAISVESIRLGPGSFSNPGPGLVPLGCGLILGILCLIVFVLTFKNPSNLKEVVQGERVKWHSVISVLISMLGFGFLIDFLGFPLAAFLWMSFVCRWIGKMGWRGTFFISVVATLSTYLLFGYLLEVRFPRGILGF